MSHPETRGGARAFVRSLNILLKFARLYEFGHAKTTQQFETTWKELRGALHDSGGGGAQLRSTADYFRDRQHSLFTNTDTAAIRAIRARVPEWECEAVVAGG